MQQTLKLQLLSITSNLSLSQDYNKSKDPLLKGCINQRCRKGYSQLLDLIHNDNSFVNFELYLAKVVIYLLIFISNVNVELLFIKESFIIQKKTKKLFENGKMIKC